MVPALAVDSAPVACDPAMPMQAQPPRRTWLAKARTAPRRTHLEPEGVQELPAVGAHAHERHVRAAARPLRRGRLRGGAQRPPARRARREACEGAKAEQRGRGRAQAHGARADASRGGRSASAVRGEERAWAPPAHGPRPCRPSRASGGFGRGPLAPPLRPPRHQPPGKASPRARALRLAGVEARRACHAVCATWHPRPDPPNSPTPDQRAVLAGRDARQGAHAVRGEAPLHFFHSPKVRASQLFRRQRDASLAHLTPDEIAMHPRGHALLEAP